MLLGAKSEKLVRQVAQLELQLEKLETTRAEGELAAPMPSELPTRRQPITHRSRGDPSHRRAVCYRQAGTWQSTGESARPLGTPIMQHRLRALLASG